MEVLGVLCWFQTTQYLCLLQLLLCQRCCVSLGNYRVTIIGHVGPLTNQSSASFTTRVMSLGRSIETDFQEQECKQWQCV